MKQGRYPIKSAREYRIEEEEIARNASRRAPIIVCVDRSYSMRQQRRLEKVMEGLETFRSDMMADPIAQDSVELCLISFGGTMARVECDFATADRIHFPKLEASGETPLADAIDLALENLQHRKVRYEDNGISFYRPWLVLIGDGDETQSSAQLEEAAHRLKREYDEKHLNVLCIIVGDEDRVEYGSLLRLAPDGKVHYLRDLKFREFFGWLSRSLKKAGQSMSGEELKYEPTGSWSERLERKG